MATTWYFRWPLLLLELCPTRYVNGELLSTEELPSPCLDSTVSLLQTWGKHFQARARADVRLMHCWAELVCAKLFGFAQLPLNFLAQASGKVQCAPQTAAQWVGIFRSRILTTASPGYIWLAVSWSAAAFRKGEVGRNCCCKPEPDAIHGLWDWSCDGSELSNV